jgi:hypothetical protein
MAKRKRTKGQKTKDRATWTPLKTWGDPEGLAVLAPHVTPIVLLLNDANIKFNMSTIYYCLYYLVTFTRKGEILKIYLKIRIACLQVPENVTA